MGRTRFLIVVAVFAVVLLGVVACTQTPQQPTTQTTTSQTPSTTTQSQTPSTESSAASPTTVVPSGTPSATTSSSAESSATTSGVMTGVSIYVAGRTSAGPVTFTGGPQNIKSAPCVLCHGDKGKGGKSGPVITWSTLMSQGYNEQTFQRAVTEGLDAEGKPLDTRMPRYKLNADELKSLTDYVRSF